MRRFPLFLALVVGLLGGARAADRPNIVLFIADDVSVGDIGCYGNAAARTPHIDALAAGGLRFTNAILTTSSCSPSRSSIITGRYPHNLSKASELHQPIAAHLVPFPELLREAGYYTALVGKDHMSWEKGEGEERSPWDLNERGNAPGNRGGHATWVQTVRDRPADQPFFFWFAAIDAHRGWDGDQDWDAEKYGPMHDPEEVMVPPFLLDNAETRRDLASYYNEVTRFDHFVGRVVDALRSQGVLENTLLLVMADNGRPFPRAKTRLHDSGMKTPLVAHWPAGIPGEGATVDGLVSAIDLAPTILDVAGVEAPASFQGVSFAPVFANPGATVREAAFSEHNWHDYEAHTRAVRAGGFLYIANHRPQLAWQGPADSVRSPSHQTLRVVRDAGGLTAAQADVFLAPRPPVELYDSRADPYQLNNLAGEPAYATRQAQLRTLLERWSEETGDTVPVGISGDTFDRETGEPLPRKPGRGEPAGAAEGADRIDAPGPR